MNSEEFDAIALRQAQSRLADIEDAYDNVVEALGADLEQGSHHFNNEAHAQFAKKYPRLVKALDKLGDRVRDR